MKEQRIGKIKQALKYYRLACENHTIKGELRACTPFLSLSLKLGQLEMAVTNLESQCKQGEDLICYYLSKQYLKIGELGKGQKH